MWTYAASSLDTSQADTPVPTPETVTEQRVRQVRSYRAIAVANQKGGVGKTTTAVNLSAALARQGCRVLLVDLDPQANATSGVGFATDKGTPTAYDVLTGAKSLRDCMVEVLPNLRLCPSSPSLAGCEVELVDEEGRETRLQRALDEVASEFDFVFVDCPPSLSLLTLNALVAAKSVLIPLQCEYYALEGVTHLLETLSRIQDSLNTDLQIEGVLLTMYDGRLNLSAQVAEEARSYFGSRVYETMIPRNVRLGEAPSFGQPITEYDLHCVGAKSYLHLAEEVLANER